MTRTIRRFCERIRNRLNRAKRCRRVRDRRPLTFDGNEHRPWGHEPRRVSEQCPARPSYILVSLDQPFPIACVEMPSPWREAPELVLRPGLRLPLQRPPMLCLLATSSHFNARNSIFSFGTFKFSGPIAHVQLIWTRPQRRPVPRNPWACKGEESFCFTCQSVNMEDSVDCIFLLRQNTESYLSAAYPSIPRYTHITYSSKHNMSITIRLSMAHNTK